MNTLDAFQMGELFRYHEQKVFDWDKAAQLIKESGATEAYAGLQEDWEGTGGQIFENGAPTSEHYTYLASTWATPILIINGEEIECYRMASEVPGWNAGTTWPSSALFIL